MKWTKPKLQIISRKRDENILLSCKGNGTTGGKTGKFNGCFQNVMCPRKCFQNTSS